MGYIGRRIGLSQDQGDSNPGGADGAVGGGILDLFSHGYFERQGDIHNAPSILPLEIEASGGVISDYTSGSDVYRAHIFTSSGTFEVSQLSNTGNPNTVEYLVVAGGGGGGNATGGGGGAGGFRTNMPGTPHSTPSAFPISTTSYPVIIGAGGAGGYDNNVPGSDGIKGGDSSFGPPSDPARVISTGGGLGRGYNAGNPGHPTGGAGGSGGGAGRGGQPYTSTGSGGPSEAISGLPVSPNSQGNDGGTGGSNGNPVGNSNHSYGGGGGGGAGAAGGNATLPNAGPAAVGGAGGAGLQLLIGGPASTTGIGALNPGPGEYGWFAGGGSGASQKQGGADGTEVAGGVGGGGKGQSSSSPNANMNGLSGTGGGGGGRGNPGTQHGGSGGSGTVILRYKIGSVSTAKATGGAISFYNNKTIHIFNNSGTLITPGSFSETCEYVVVAGGGAGEGDASGGGGAGGYRTGTTPVGSSVTLTVTVGGGGHRGINNENTPGQKGSNSSVNLLISSKYRTSKTK